MSREKNFLVEQKGNLYFIRLQGGGEVPDRLKGMWTSPDIASQFIQRFLEDEEKEEQLKKVAPKKATAKA